MCSRSSYQHVHEIGGVVLDEFSLRADSVAFPLGWTLARATMKTMDAQIAAMADNPSSRFNWVLSLSR